MVDTQKEKGDNIENLRNEDEFEYKNKLTVSFKVDCKKCFGLCCIALYFSASDGFPKDKEAGIPCINLQGDFTCAVHKSLRERGLKGCTAYDCFGAGQKVAQDTFKGKDWKKNPELGKQIFEVFLIMRQLYEMLWYVTEAIRVKLDGILQEELIQMADRTTQHINRSAEELLALDITAHRFKVNTLLKQVSEQVRTKIASAGQGSKGNKSKGKRMSYFGADLRKANLRGADLRGALLIAANLRGLDLSGADFIGADLRDADFGAADLSKSIFLTQAQINTAKGDIHTKLPPTLSRPSHWVK